MVFSGNVNLQGKIKKCIGEGGKKVHQHGFRGPDVPDGLQTPKNDVRCCFFDMLDIWLTFGEIFEKIFFDPTLPTFSVVFFAIYQKCKINEFKYLTISPQNYPD